MQKNLLRCSDGYPDVEALEGRASTSPTPADSFAFLDPGKGGTPALPRCSGKHSSRLIQPSQQSKTLSAIKYNDTDNLEDVDERILNPTVKCTPKFVVKQCGCGEDHRKILPSTCMKSYCINCAKYFSAKRASRVMKRIESLSKWYNHERHYPTMIYTVFTIPKHLRDKYIDPKVSRDLRCRIWKLLKDSFGGTWAIESTHPISEKHPKIFHPHFNFLWQSKKFRGGFIDANELLNIKLRYAELIGYEGIPDVDTQYSSDIKDLWHNANYVTRNFPEFAKWAGPVRYFGQIPKIEKEEACLCEKCHQKYIVIGYLTPEKSMEFYRHELDGGTDPPSVTSFDINFIFEP